MLNLDTLTDDQITQLKINAGQYGDYATVACCEVALGLDPRVTRPHLVEIAESSATTDYALEAWLLDPTPADIRDARREIVGIINESLALADED